MAFNFDDVDEISKSYMTVKNIDKVIFGGKKSKTGFLGKILGNSFEKMDY